MASSQVARSPKGWGKDGESAAELQCRSTTTTHELVRRIIAIAAVVVFGVGCSSGGSSKPQNGPVSDTPKGTSRPTFVPAQAVAAEPIDGASVWVDEAARTVYVTDCDVARRITAEGQKYGPGPRDPQTSKFTPGYAFICP